mgnify:CR=1 FL=1
MLRIERTGFTTVQDAGRSGFAHLGVPTSGAADRSSYLLANRLAGNAPGAALFETAGGLSFSALDDVNVVITGAECDAVAGGRLVAHCAAFMLRRGETLTMSRVREGVRSYVAVSGGILGTAILGSLSHDSLSSIEPLALQPGTELAVGTPVAAPSSLDIPIRPAPARTLRVTKGPHHDFVSVSDSDFAARNRFRVSTTSNRIGVRLLADGPSKAGTAATLRSVPLVRGAVQLTPSGEIVLMLADHPTTGGYPVIAVAQADDVDRLAQTPADAAVTLAWSQ